MMSLDGFLICSLAVPYNRPSMVKFILVCASFLQFTYFADDGGLLQHIMSDRYSITVTCNNQFCDRHGVRY